MAGYAGPVSDIGIGPYGEGIYEEMTCTVIQVAWRKRVQAGTRAVLQVKNEKKNPAFRHCVRILRTG